MNWTEEQLAVIDAIARGEGNLVCNAVAGSGKTTTIIEGVNQWGKDHHGFALLCAFNKRIAEELQRRVTSPSITCATMNSLGHRAWMKMIQRKRVELDTKKTFKCLNGHFDFGQAGDSPRLVSLLKSCGWVPDATAKKWGLRGGLVPDADEVLEDRIEEHGLDVPLDRPTLSGLSYFDTIRAVMDKSVSMAFEGIIDFDDQLYMSCLWQAPFEKFELVMVDEAQDINLIQQKILRLCLTPHGRLMAVGDRYQAIYAFRGATTNAIDKIKEEFDAAELPLNTSFRCPQAVVAEARQYVPQICSAPDAFAGKVSTATSFKTADFMPTDVILCRNVKPIVSLCFALLRAQIPAAVLGRDIGRGLIALVKKTRRKGEEKLADFTSRLSAWSKAQQSALLAKDKESAADSLADKVETILTIADTFDEAVDPNPTIDHLCHRIELMFKDDTSRLTLSTIHKAKGLEWPRVFFLDPWRIPSRFAKTPAAVQQERNCAYVAITRAQEELIYLNEKDIEL